MVDQKRFYVSLPVFSDFAEVVRADSFSPLADQWFVGFTDVTGSTAAIAAGRYKAVNMVGAGAIAAVANALGRRPFPFVFGGDGVSLAAQARMRLQRRTRWRLWHRSLTPSSSSIFAWR
jgi:hypothetical protein